MSVVSIKVFDTKKAADTFYDSVGDLSPKRYGPISGFALSQIYDGTNKPVVTHPKAGTYYMVVVER